MMRVILFSILLMQSLLFGKVTVPDDFKKVVSEIGVDVYKHKDSNIYVQVVDLVAGAKVKLHLTPIENEDAGDKKDSKYGRFNGKNPTFVNWDIDDIWKTQKDNSNELVAVSNASFFESDSIPYGISISTLLTFPIVINSELISSGSEKNNNSKENGLRMLEIFSNKANIKEVDSFNTDDFLSQTKAPNILVGHYVDLDKTQYDDSNERKGRTMIGVADNNDDGVDDTILILVAESATITNSVQHLLNFNCTDNSNDEYKTNAKVIKLDGSYSSQLVISGNKKVSYLNNRELPEFILTYKKSISSSENYCPINTIPFNDGGGIYMHEWVNGIYLQNCKEKDENIAELAVFKSGYIVKKGFWKEYQKNNFGVNYLGSPKSNEEILLQDICQAFTNGIFLWNQNAGVRALIHNDVNCNNYTNYQIPKCTLTDVFENTEYSDEICKIKSAGIVNGYNDGSYKPARTISRAEFTKIILLAKYSESEIKKAENQNFTDIPDNAWYKNYVNFAKEKGIVKGYGDSTFKPDQTITYAEASKIIVNVLIGKVDDKNSNDWYTPYVLKLKDKGITKFKPMQPLNRGEMAYIISKLKGS